MKLAFFAAPTTTKHVRPVRLGMSTRLSILTRRSISTRLYTSKTWSRRQNISLFRSELSSSQHPLTHQTRQQHSNVHIRKTRPPTKTNPTPHPSAWLWERHTFLHNRNCLSRYPDTTTLRNNILRLRRSNHQSYDHPPWQPIQCSGNSRSCTTSLAPYGQTEGAVDRRDMYRSGKHS